MRVDAFSKNISCDDDCVVTRCYTVLVYRVMLAVTGFLCMKCGRIMNTSRRECMM